MKPLLWEKQGYWYHGGALLYALTGYVLGLAGLLADGWLVNLGALVLLAHAMTIAAYLVHECAHNTIFRVNAHNARLGGLLTWLCGAAYGRYEDIRYKHFRHHVDNDDVVWFDYEKFFVEHPLVLRVTRALEWAYVPAHEIVMHAILVFTSFVIPQRRDQRVRNVAVLCVRGGLFAVLAWWSLKAALLYAVAYMLMMIVLRFMDSLQHDYDYHLTLFDNAPSERRGDREWEQVHTFSNPLSMRFEPLNWLTLNFGFHNAHHARPTTPWYRLPALHRKLFGDGPEHVIRFGAQLRIYHQGRVERIVKWDSQAEEAATAPLYEGREFLLAAQRAEVSGGNAASFLTAF